MSTIVVGAGVTGLTLADKLLSKERDVVVLEREPLVGGLCRSYRYDDFIFDIGPHRLFSSDPVVHDYFLDVLQDQFGLISRDSQVHMNGKYLNWPLSVGALFQMPPGQSLKCFVDLINRRPGVPAEVKSLKDYVLAHYGPTIFETFWEGYTEKFLGVRCSDVDAIWGHISVGRSIVDRSCEPDSILQLAYNALLPRKSKLEFLYPRGGMGVFCDLQARRVDHNGGHVAVSHPVTAIRTEGTRIVEVKAGDAVFPVDRLVWTGTLTELCRLLDEPLPQLEYLSTILYNIEVDGKLPGKWQWIYFPDSKCVFSRVSCPSRFGAECAPDGKDGLCVEISCSEGDDVWQSPEARLDDIYACLVDVGLLTSREQVQACHIERVPNTYPIYRVGFQEKVDAALLRLTRFENLDIVGRQAAFVHDNIDEAVESVFALTDEMLGRKKEMLVSAD